MEKSKFIERLLSQEEISCEAALPPDKGEYRYALAVQVAAHLLSSPVPPGGVLIDLYSLPQEVQIKVLKVAEDIASDMQSTLLGARKMFDPTERQIIEGKKHKIMLGIPHLNNGSKDIWMRNMQGRSAVVPPDANLYMKSTLEMSSADARNSMVKAAIANGVTHLMFVDDDVIPNEDDYILRLFEHNKDVVCGLYYKKIPGAMAKQKVSACTKLDKNGSAKYVSSQETELLPAYCVCAGLLLIRVSIFEKMDFPWFKTTITSEGHKVIDDDGYFSERCRMSGVEMWIDPAVQGKHISREGAGSF